MKKKNTVIFNSNDEYRASRKLIALIVMVIFLTISLVRIFSIKHVNDEFAKQADNFFKLNEKTVYSIDKIYMYSSADAIKNKVTRPLWNLDIYQYTDIALYINNRDGNKLDYENSIKEMYIENVKFSNFNKGEQKLYYKNPNYFGRGIFNYYSASTDENQENSNTTNENISNADDTNSNSDETSENNQDIKNIEVNPKLAYQVLNNGDLDYSKPEIYCDATNPITLEFVNQNVKKNQILSDVTTDVTYNGSLLKRAGVVLSDISGSVSFEIVIINNYDQKYICNVYLEIPLNDTVTGKNIYDGKFEKTQDQENIFKFYRTK